MAIAKAKTNQLMNRLKAYFKAVLTFRLRISINDVQVVDAIRVFTIDETREDAEDLADILAAKESVKAEGTIPWEQIKANLVTLNIFLEQEDDGRWIAEVLELPGVMAYGASESDAIANAKALAFRVGADQELVHFQINKG